MTPERYYILYLYYKWQFSPSTSLHFSAHVFLASEHGRAPRHVKIGSSLYVCKCGLGLKYVPQDLAVRHYAGQCRMFSFVWLLALIILDNDLSNFPVLVFPHSISVCSAKLRK